MKIRHNAKKLEQTFYEEETSSKEMSTDQTLKLLNIIQSLPDDLKEKLLSLD